MEVASTRVWCGSTEIFLQPGAVHGSIEAFEKGLAENDINIAPSMIYAYAALMEGVPFANGSPNLTVNLPIMQTLSKMNSAPICGKGFQDRADLHENRARACI